MVAIRGNGRASADDITTFLLVGCVSCIIGHIVAAPVDCPTTFVLQGELRFRRPDVSFKEVRPTASHVQVAANGEPHSERAGDQTAIVLFSFRGTIGDMIHCLDESSNVVFSLAFADFKAAIGRQVASGVATRLAPRRA